MPFRTTLQPAAKKELTRRAKETYGTERAANRVIEEAMGCAAVKYSETEDVEITVENDEFYGDIAVVVELFPGTNEARVDSASYGGKPFTLSEADQGRAIKAAWQKREEA